MSVISRSTLAETTTLAAVGRTATAAANTAVTQTITAVAGESHRLVFLAFSYSSAPTGGRVTVADGGTTILDLDVTAGGPYVVVLPGSGLEGTAGQALTVTLAAAGVAVVGKLNTGVITE
jgi:hypothetical protein